MPRVVVCDVPCVVWSPLQAESMGSHVTLREATFNPGTSKRCWTEDLASSLRSKQGSSGIIAEGLLNDYPFTTILGITVTWEKDERPSSSGAKLYIGNPNANTTKQELCTRAHCCFAQ